MRMIEKAPSPLELFLSSCGAALSVALAGGHVTVAVLGVVVVVVVVVVVSARFGQITGVCSSNMYPQS